MIQSNLKSDNDNMNLKQDNKDSLNLQEKNQIEQAKEISSQRSFSLKVAQLSEFDQEQQRIQMVAQRLKDKYLMLRHKNCKKTKVKVFKNKLKLKAQQMLLKNVQGKNQDISQYAEGVNTYSEVKKSSICQNGIAIKNQQPQKKSQSLRPNKNKKIDLFQIKLKESSNLIQQDYKLNIKNSQECNQKKRNQIKRIKAHSSIKQIQLNLDRQNSSYEGKKISILEQIVNILNLFKEIF